VKPSGGVDVKPDAPPVHSIYVISHNLTRKDLFRDGEIYPQNGSLFFAVRPVPVSFPSGNGPGRLTILTMARMYSADSTSLQPDRQ